MQMQTAQTGGDDVKLTGANPEILMAPQPEQPPVNSVEDISGLNADKKAIAEASVEEVTSTEGGVFKTLRVAPEVLPTVQDIESDPAHQIKREIEAIMQADLVEYDPKARELTGLFTELPPERQELLKNEGERIANEIVLMIRSGKYNPGEVHDELVRWLKIIPDANQPWVIQMATIKNDKILSLVNQISRDKNMLN